MEAGAFFEGNCRHADNPLADDDGSKEAAHDSDGLNATSSANFNCCLAASASGHETNRPLAR